MIIKIKDTNNEVYHLNPQSVAYIKERPNHQMWKVVLVTGEMIMTREKGAVHDLLDILKS